jgi:hypothetical protein
MAARHADRSAQPNLAWLDLAQLDLEKPNLA